MTNLIQSPESGISLADYTQEIFEEMPEVAGNEKDYEVVGNRITITFGSEYGDFKLTVLVSFLDTPKSLYERFVQELSSHLDDIDAMIKWDEEHYEHPSVTQGYPFDSLTC